MEMKKFPFDIGSVLSEYLWIKANPNLKVKFLRITSISHFTRYTDKKQDSQKAHENTLLKLIRILLDNKKLSLTHIKYVKLKLKRCFCEILMKVFFENFTASRGGINFTSDDGFE